MCRKGVVANGVNNEDEVKDVVPSEKYYILITTSVIEWEYPEDRCIAPIPGIVPSFISTIISDFSQTLTGKTYGSF